MSTVASRTFKSSPQREAQQTWFAIVDLLTASNASARADLIAVGGIAASIISDRAPTDDAIIVTCDGPRTRIYCLYDDDAVEGSDANEEPLGFDPLKGDWAISLPCLADDLSWVRAALEKHGSRVTARGLGETASTDKSNTQASADLTFDARGFLGS